MNEHTKAICKRVFVHFLSKGGYFMVVNTFEPNDDGPNNLNDDLGKALARTLQDLNGIKKKYGLTESGCHLMFVNSFIFYLVEYESVDE